MEPDIKQHDQGTIGLAASYNFFFGQTLSILKDNVTDRIDELDEYIRIQTNLLFVPLEESLKHHQTKLFFKFLMRAERKEILSSNLYKQLVNYMLTGDVKERKVPVTPIAHVIVHSKIVYEFGYGSVNSLGRDIEKYLNPLLEVCHWKMNMQTATKDGKETLHFLLYPL